MGNAMGQGYDALEEIEQLGHHIVAVHAKEFAGPPRTAPGSPNGLNAKPFGEGEGPLRAGIAALRRTGYEQRHGYLTLETGAFGDALGSAAKALAVLRRGWAAGGRGSRPRGWCGWGEARPRLALPAAWCR